MQLARVPLFLLSPSGLLSAGSTGLNLKISETWQVDTSSVGQCKATARRCAPRARMAAGALVDAAVQWLGQVWPESRRP